MKIRKGDKVVLDYKNFDSDLRKAFGKKIPDIVEGTVGEVRRFDRKVWFTIVEDVTPEHITEFYPAERIIELNGNRI